MMVDMLTTDFDGCGRCLVGVRRLSRKTDATSSPQRIRFLRLPLMRAVM
jgi:site-specific DNA recombinase